MHQREIYEISYNQGFGNRKAKADAILALVPGCPLMITSNISIPLGTLPPVIEADPSVEGTVSLCLTY
jgi:hypothetical protein